MEKHRAIPQGYMTVGEIAKKMGVSVRTLQYYDREGLLSPSSESEGGRRLYTDRDCISLHQILSLKHLGFSLADIKRHLVSLDAPADVAKVLAEQEMVICDKIEALSETLRAIRALKAEVLQMQTVDFKKYADIVVNLRMKNEIYWAVKYLDDDVLDRMRSRFQQEGGQAMFDTLMRTTDEAVRFHACGVPPDGEQGQKLAREFWDCVVYFTDGDMNLLPKLLEVAKKMDTSGDAQHGQQIIANAFIQSALGIYFTKLGINPFEGSAKHG